MLDTYLVQSLDIDIHDTNPNPWQDLFECNDLSMAEQYIMIVITAAIINTKGSQIQTYVSADHRHWIMISNGPRTTHYRIVPSSANKDDIPEFSKEIGPDGYKYNTQKNKHETARKCAEKIMNEMYNEEEMWYKSDKVYPCNPLLFGEWCVTPKDDPD